MTRRLGVLVALLAFAATASADKPKPKTPPAAKKPAPAKADAKADAPDAADGSAADGSAEDGSAAPGLPHLKGPQHVNLGNNTEIELPAGMILFEHDAAKQIVEKDGGNGDSIEAIIIPEDEAQTWFVNIDYADAGYVNDSDANQLDAGELLKAFQDGTAEQNTRRRSLGVPELFIDGWSEKPRYERANHHLVWSLNAHDTSGPVINAFTRILGRNGFLSVNLVDAPDKIEKSKLAAASVLSATKFTTGYTYEDHKSSDKDSGMGLKALVLGGAGVAVYATAKTGGLIAVLLGLKKLLIVLVAGIAAFFKKIFGRGKNVELPPDGPPSDGPPPIG